MVLKGCCNKKVGDVYSGITLLHAGLLFKSNLSFTNNGQVLVVCFFVLTFSLTLTAQGVKMVRYWGTG